MISNISQDRRRIVRKIIVNRVDASKKMSKELFNRANIKSYGNRLVVESRKEIAHQLLQDYLRDSSVHGVKYFGNLQIKSGIVGKLFWTIIMICSFVSAVLSICQNFSNVSDIVLLVLSWMLWKFWIRYSDNPTRSIIESFHTPISRAIFPAITICPLIPPMAARRRKVLDSLRLPRNMSNRTAKFLVRYGPAFANENAPGGLKHLNNLRLLLKTNDITLIDFVKALRPCEDLFESCMWEGIEKNCSELFKVSYTFAGICCSFNYLLEDYIETDRTKHVDDFLTSTMYGPESGLVVVLHRDFLVENDDTEEKYVKYSTNSVGLVMFPHHPLEYVSTLATRQILQAKQELRVSVIPFTTKKLAGYYRRNFHGKLVPDCADEKTELRYFPSYKLSNCFTSCSIQAVLQICGCVPLYYTPIANKYSLRICDWEDFQCLYMNVNKTRIINNVVEENFTCECLTPCWNVMYELRTSSLLLSGGQDFNLWHVYKNLSNAQSILRIFMRSATFMELNTIPVADELYLLASLGGVFSLFLGCSFISALEILYFIGLFFRSNFKKSK